MKKVSARKARTRYAEIQDVLQNEIEQGAQKLGACLPKEHDLCDRFSASRFTVRQALAGLKELGLIEARPDVGTFVVADRPREMVVQTLNSFEELLQYPAETNRQQLDVSTVTASAELALMLRCGTGQKWVKLNAMRLARGSPALTTVRRYRGSDGDVYLVTCSIHPENRFSLNFELQKQ
ncbi:MAG: GntR family transcriptional regulator [Halocynthiibacter sp.]